MNTRFQSALNQIKADEALISKTEVYLRDKLAESQEPKIIKFRKCRFANIKNLAKAACIIFILAGGSTGTYAYYKTPVAYLSLDINPSIEIGVNAFNKVVTAEGYNADGKAVLNGITVKGSDITTAVSTMISSAANNGFIYSDGSTVVSLTSETDDVNTANKLETEAETGVNEALKEEGKIAVIIKDNVDLALRNEAREKNITPGKLNLIKKLQAVNPVVTVEQYKDAKVKDIMKAIQTRTNNDVVYNEGEAVVNSKTDIAGKEKNKTSSKQKTAVKDQNKVVVNNTSKEAASKKVEIAARKDKNVVSGKKESIVSSKGENVVSNKDENTANNENKEVVDNKHEAAVNSKRKGDVHNNKRDAADNEDKTVRKQQRITGVKNVIKS